MKNNIARFINGTWVDMLDGDNLGPALDEYVMFIGSRYGYGSKQPHNSVPLGDEIYLFWGRKINTDNGGFLYEDAAGFNVGIVAYLVQGAAIARCPICNADNTEVREFVWSRTEPETYCVECKLCGNRGPRSWEQLFAISAWNDLPRSR